jgi:hypothetical protein
VYYSYTFSADRNIRTKWLAVFKSYVKIYNVASGVIVVPGNLLAFLGSGMALYEKTRIPNGHVEQTGPQPVGDPVFDFNILEHALEKSVTWITPARVKQLLQQFESILPLLSYYTPTLFQKIKGFLEHPLLAAVMLAAKQEDWRRDLIVGADVIKAIVPVLPEPEWCGIILDSWTWLLAAADKLLRLVRPQNSGPRKWQQAYQRPSRQ